MCFPPRLQATGGKWPLHHSFGTPALSLTPSFMFLFDQAEKHECNKGEKKKDGNDILGFAAAFRRFVSSPLVTACVYIQSKCAQRCPVHSQEHSVLHMRLLSSLRQVLIDFSVILKIKITGDVVERRAHNTWAAIPFNWVCVMPQVIVCICIFIIQLSFWS